MLLPGSPNRCSVSLRTQSLLGCLCSPSVHFTIRWSDPRIWSLPSSYDDKVAALSHVSCHIWWTASSVSFSSPNLFYLFFLVLIDGIHALKCLTTWTRNLHEWDTFCLLLFCEKSDSSLYGSLIVANDDNARKIPSSIAGLRDSFYVQRNNFRVFSTKQNIMLNVSFSQFIS